jgi:CrcB protein
MSAAFALGIGVLGGVGALARVLLDRAIVRRARGAFPFGILAVNVSGALALGVLVGLAPDADTYRLLGSGLLGAYTTFSTWMVHSHRLGPRLGALNVAGSLALGIAAVWLGSRLGMAL